MRKTSVRLAFSLLGCLAWTGCGPALTPDDLGEVVFTTPEVPGTEENYVLKDLPLPFEETPETPKEPPPLPAPR